MCTSVSNALEAKQEPNVLLLQENLMIMAAAETYADTDTRKQQYSFYWRQWKSC